MSGREQLGDWIAQAELLTVRDLDGPHAELLVQAGITTLAALAALRFVGNPPKA